jgi:tetratricopeptide (TPR) repeat protein
MRGLPPQPATVFVGRERELATLRAALAAAIAGHGRLVLLAGEPGIGKTRLAEEIARHASAEGAAVRWGRCWEGAGAPAFWPWIQVLRSQFAETDPAELRAQLGTGAEDVAQLVPELHERVPGIPPPPSLEGADARFRLFDSVARFLRAAAVARPLALILEDVHWADAASLGLLRFLADEMQGARLLIVATYRDIEVTAAHPLSEFVGALAYHPLLQRVELHGLSEDEIGRLIEALGHEGSPSLVARIHRQSGGNPFFATEIARAPDGAGIPGGVRDAIGNRLRRLSEECNRLLGIASVIGPEFGLGTLEQVAVEVGDCAPVLRVLNEAKDAHIVVEAQAAAGGYRFAHALIREVLYTGLPLEVRLRLHWHVTTALEALGGSNQEHGASTLAHHFLEAIGGCAQGAPRQACVDKAVLHATKAAEQATAMCAYEEAAGHYQRALRTLEEWDAHDARRECELLLELGEAQTRAGAAYAVRSKAFHRAAARARALCAPEVLARAALGLAAGAALLEAATDAHIALLQEALQAVGTHDSPMRARLLGCLALAKYYPDPQLHSAPLSEEAVAIARRVRDPHTLGFVLCDRYAALMGPGHAEERMSLATEILQLGEQLGHREMVMSGRWYRLCDAFLLGHIATVERELAVYTQLADDMRQPFLRSRAVAVRAALALLGGGFAEAEQLALGALRLTRHAEDPRVWRGYETQLGVAYWEQGRFGELEGPLKGMVEQSPLIPGMRAVLALFYAEMGRAEEAHAEIEYLSNDHFRALPRDLSWFHYVGLLAYASAIVGDAAHAAKLHALLTPHRRCLIITQAGPVCLGSVSFLLGLLAHAMGRWDAALADLDEALAVHRRIGSPPWIANTNYASAAVLLTRDGPGDRERASALLAEVLRTTEQLGMLRLQRRALALQDHVNNGIGVSAAPAGSPVPKRANATFRKEGEYWVVGHKTPAFRLKDRLGLWYLSVLLRDPGREFLAIDLVATVQGGPGGSVSDDVTERVACDGSEPYFDEQTRREYAQRLRALRDALQEAQAFNDRERTSRTQAEIDLLTDELQRGVGLGRRVRAAGSPVERARVSVTRAIRAALRGIAANDAALGHYLAATVKTGTFCSYSPDPRAAVAWEL